MGRSLIIAGVVCSFVLTACGGKEPAITVTASDLEVTVEEDDQVSIDLDVVVGGEEPPTPTVVISAEPGHGVVDGGGLVWTYTPVPDFFGTDIFEYTATAGGVADTGTVTVIVTPVNDAPTTADITLVGDEEAQVTGTLPAADIEGDVLRWTIVAPPATGRVALDPASGFLTWTPEADFNGSETLGFQVSDGELSSNDSVATLTVNALNDPPLVEDGIHTVDEDTTLGADLMASDVDGDTLTWSILIPPAHGIATVDAATGSFTYVGLPDFNGSDFFTFQVDDGTVASSSATIWLMVTPVNDAPIGLDLNLPGQEDAPTTGQVVAFDIDGDALTFAISTPPASGSVTLDPSSGLFTYLPVANFAGPDTFEFTVTDGTLVSPPAVVTVTVGAANDAPVAEDGLGSTSEDQPYGGLALASDAEADPLTFAVAIPAANGTVVMDPATGSFTYSPAQDFSGRDAFGFRANDGQADSNVATFTIDVGGVNDVPVALDGSASTTEDATLTGLLRATDADGDTLSFGVVAPPSDGRITVVGATGVYTYVPTPDFVGSTSFTFQVNDGLATSNVGTISLTIDPVNDAPLAQAATFTTPEDTTLAGVVAGSDVEGDPLSFALVSGPTPAASFNLDPTNGAFTFDPAPDFVGEVSFTFTVADGTALSAPATARIEVTPVNDAPLTAAGTFTFAEDTTGSGLLGATDIDGDSLTYLLQAPAASGTVVIDPVTGFFSYQPAADFNGSDSFDFVVNDGTIISTPATIGLTVTPVNDAPTTSGQSIVTDEDTAFVGSLGGVDIDGDPLSWNLVVLPTSGTVVIIPGTGAFLYTPAADYHGADTFGFQVSDGALSSQLRSVNVTITSVNDAPDTSISSGPLDPTRDNGGVLVFTSTDDTAVAGHDCRLDGSAWVPCTSGIAVGPLAPGSHLFEVRAVDSDAVVDPSPAAWSWEVLPPDLLDDFELGVPDPTVWSAVQGDAATTNVYSERGVYSLEMPMNGAPSTVVSHPIDTSGCSALSFGLWIKRGPFAPDVAEFLRLQFFDGVGWVDLFALEGNWLTDPNFLRYHGAIGNPLAFGPDLRVRLVTEGNFDEWFVDDFAFGCDSDGDLLTDAEERDRYGTNVALTDTDSDGYEDGFEIRVGTDPLDPLDPSVLDSDADGLVDQLEPFFGTSAFNPDSDFDGLSDGDEVFVWNLDPTNPDMDGDGLNDGEEVNTYFTDPLVQDTDGDTFDDWTEVFIYASDPNDPSDPDPDGDGLASIDETTIWGTDPLNSDSDGDGLGDGEEVFTTGTNPALADTDGDGLDDGDELTVYFTDPLNPDTDGDGLVDGQEVVVWGTDPNLIDTDGDGLGDGAEVALGLDPTLMDTDGDGLGDGVEIAQGTDPLLVDSDGDTFGDGVDNCPVIPNPAQTDTDGDGRGDGCQWILDSMPVAGFDPQTWVTPVGGDTGVSGAYAYSGLYSINLGGGGGLLEARPIDTTAATCPQLAWSYWVKRGPEQPDFTEFLRLQYFDGFVWVDLDAFEGGAVDPAFNRRWGTTVALAARVPALQVRFTSIGSGVGFDDFFLDDISVGCDEDLDGLATAEEIIVHGTNPLLANTDGDPFDDGTEVQNGTDPLDPADW